MKEAKMFNNELAKGPYTIYQHFFNIICSNEDTEITKLEQQLQNQLSYTNITSLNLHQADTSFVVLLAKNLGIPEKIKTYIRLFATLKWFYRNDRKYLENNSLYVELSSNKGSTVVIQSSQDTHDKLRLMLKAVNSEPVLIKDLLAKTLMLPTYQSVVVALWTVVRNMKSIPATKTLVKLLKSEEFCCVVQVLFDKFCTVDIMNDFKLEYDFEATSAVLHQLVIELSNDHSDYLSTLEVGLVVSTNLTIPELEDKNKQLKQKYKDLKALRYQEELKLRSGKQEELPSDIAKMVNEKIYKIDFGLTIQQKKDLLSTSNFLLLKSDGINIVPIMDNIRMENTSTVTNEVLKGDYDAVVIVTVRISHGDTDRIKGVIGNTPLIYTSRTNRKLIIEDIYNQF